MRVDLDNVEYLILLGTNPLEANVGTPYWARKLMAFKANGGKLIVVDPFFTHTASKADTWIPIKPGTDLAMLMGIMRWILDNNRHQSNYLSIPNENTASSAGYKNYTDAAFLVKTAEGKGEEFLNASEAGLSKGVTTLTSNISSSDKVISVQSTNTFPSNGYKKVCVEAYRGYWGHTNGYQTSRALNILNTILGRVDKIGGYCTSKRFGGKEPSKPVSSGLTSGVRIDRAGSKYEGTVTKPTRQGYPVASVVTQEAIPSMAVGYPYNSKITARR